MRTGAAASRPQPVVATSVDESGRPPLATGTTVLFYGFVILMLIEWIGVASMVPGMRALRISTMLAYGLVVGVLMKQRRIDLLDFKQPRLHLAFLVFTILSCLWAVVTRNAIEDIRPHVDYFGLMVVAAYLIDRPSRLRVWSMAAVVIVLVLVPLNLNILTSSARQGVMQAGYFLGDGNDFGWGLVVLLPFALYLVVGPHPILVRLLGLVGVGATIFGVVGTQSRGASLAVGAAFLYYGLFVVRNKGLFFAGILVAALAGVALAPSHYKDRMKSLDAIEEDNSAQGRLRAWRAAAQMAVEFPLGVGAGNFNSAFGRYYVPVTYEGWGSQRWISAHSVYFKVLGEYGILGVILILSIIVTNFRANLASMRRFAANPDAAPVDALWPGLLNMSLVGYCVSAIFLGGTTYPHLYLLSGLTLAMTRLWLVRVPPAAAPALAGPAR